MIWMLCLILVIGTLDAIPDPPAVNPGSVQCKVPPLHNACCDTVPQPSDSIATSYSFATNLFSAERLEPYRPSDRLVNMGLAADSSPPSS